MGGRGIIHRNLQFLPQLTGRISSCLCVSGLVCMGLWLKGYNFSSTVNTVAFFTPHKMQQDLSRCFR